MEGGTQAGGDVTTRLLGGPGLVLVDAFWRPGLRAPSTPRLWLPRVVPLLSRPIPGRRSVPGVVLSVLSLPGSVLLSVGPSLSLLGPVSPLLSRLALSLARPGLPWRLTLRGLALLLARPGLALSLALWGLLWRLALRGL